MQFFNIWEKSSSILPKPITEWKEYTNYKYIKNIGDASDHQVFLIHLNVYENVWIEAVVKLIRNFKDLEHSNLEELLILRRLARYDGTNFCIPLPENMELAPGESPINAFKGLVTTLGYINPCDGSGSIGILFPVFDGSIFSNYSCDDEFRKNVFINVLAGLTNLHAWGFRHNDIKYENVLVSKRGEIVLADFGISDCGKNVMPVVQTRPYRPLEGFRDIAKYSKKTDIFALGCLYRYLTLSDNESRYPIVQCFHSKFKEFDWNERFNYFKRFPLEVDNRYCFRIYDGQMEKYQFIWNRYDDWMDQDILRKMLDMNPDIRPSSFYLFKKFGISNTMRMPRVMFPPEKNNLTLEEIETADKIFSGDICKLVHPILLKKNLNFKFLNNICFVIRSLYDVVVDETV
jgi:serine/threonine protein kinase